MIFSLFQSTLPHGSDGTEPPSRISTCTFQSTLPHGSDKPAYRHGSGNRYFDPRSLTGATLRNRQCAGRRKFQSTLPHGSDGRLQSQPCFRSHFNPRSLTGATTSGAVGSFAASYFNPRSLTGATTVFFSPSVTAAVFQSTLPYGSDQRRAVH